jgi:DNA polymerase III sliding clamp (beta) subunit (PCNA family)
MKVTANRAALLAQVKTVSKAVPAAAVVEVLKGILVERMKTPVS